MSLWLDLAYFLNLLKFKKTTIVSNNFTLAFQHDFISLQMTTPGCD